MVDHRLPMLAKAGYGAGQVAGQLFRDAPSLLLLFFLTSVIGIDPATAGIAIFVPKVIWGVVSDLGIGILSDRLLDRFPRRRWLLVGAVAAPIMMVCLFAVPTGSQGLSVAYVAVVFSLYMIAFSTFSVPYLAQFAEITDDPGERTVLMAWRHGFTGVGVLIGSSFIPVQIHALGGGRSAYAAASWTLAAICVVSLLAAYRASAGIVASVVVSTRMTIKSMLGVLNDRPFLALGCSAFAQTVGAGMSYATFAFFLTYTMARVDAFVQLGLISMIMAVVVIAGSPIWVFVAKRIGKKNTYLLAAFGHAAVTLAWGLSPHAPMPVIYVYAALVGLFNSGWGLISLSMLADMIAASREETGQDRAGSFAALWSIIEKVGIALGGTLVAGLMLSASGFSAAIATHGGVQPASASEGIAMAYAFAPAALKLVAFVIVLVFIEPNATFKASAEKVHT